MASSKVLLILLALVAGGCFVIQQAVNARLRTHLESSYWPAFYSYLGGTLAMSVVLLAIGETSPSAVALRSAPWWAWTGGIFGTVYICTAIVLLPRYGAAATVGCIVLGQMLTSLMLDRLGALSVPVHSMTPGRILGVIMLIVGTFLIRR